MTIEQVCVVGFVALVAGLLGGMSGVGGSILILPALHVVFGPLLFGEPEGRPQIHHSFMAAAMTVNVVVSLPSAFQHHRLGAVRVSLLPILLPSTAIAMLLGVVLSNRFDGDSLRLALAVFLCLYGIWNMRLILRPRRRAFEGHGRTERVDPARLSSCGASTGFFGGLLGLGGGFMLVPLLQIVCNLRLKNAIATSSAVLCITAALGAGLKLATLHSHGETVGAALALAAAMAPTGALGAMLGSSLLHKIPPTGVRVAMTTLVLLAAARLFA